ncbi:MAG: hypothetical protein GY835_22355, partial [bacterium]|nr:hypothetical protein [bacterium]
YSPYIGTADFFGETWNCVLADSATKDGIVTDGTFAFDFNDEYFLPGDIIEHFFWGQAIDGSIETRPGWALSTEADLRSAYIVRCLPTDGVELLFVNDGERGFGRVPRCWREAFQYCGYPVFDQYRVMAPTSGLENGLAGRATYDDIAGYRTIVWDSSDIPRFTITSAVTLDKTFDDVLLDGWLNDHNHDASLWIMGCEVASSMTNATAFLGANMGVNLLSEDQFYDDYTSVLVPKVFASHPALAY